MTQAKNTPTTEADINTAICRDQFYGQLPQKVVVPTGYAGPKTVNGIAVEESERATVPYIVPAEGGRLGFDGVELKADKHN